MEPSQILFLTKTLAALVFVLFGVYFFAVSSRRAAAQVRVSGAEGSAARRLRFWRTLGFRIMAIGYMLLGATLEAPTIELVVVMGVLACIVIVAGPIIGLVIPQIVLAGRSASPAGGTPHEGASRE